MILCKCGCGGIPKEGNKFLHGHDSKLKLNSGAFGKGNIPHNKGIPQSAEDKEKNRVGHLGQISPMKGKHHTEESKKKQSDSHKGIPVWNTGKKCPEISKRQLEKIGGTQKYWNKQTLIRDNYTCQICGLKESDIMLVDHVLPKSIHPELKLDPNNLQTLCPNCHARKTIREIKDQKYNKTHNYKEV